MKLETKLTIFCFTTVYAMLFLKLLVF